MGRRFARGSQEGSDTNQPSPPIFGGGPFAEMGRGQFDGGSCEQTQPTNSPI
jgi:hypothetical protein